MSKGYQQHQQRLFGLSAFGKDLTRRSGAHCELCGAAGVSLKVHEVPPILGEPSVDRCIFVCTTCGDQIDHPKRRDPEHWHCLSKAVWSPEPAVKVMSVCLLRYFRGRTDWAEGVLDDLYIEPEVAAWLDEIPPYFQ